MPYFGFYRVDIYYIVLVIPCIILALWAQAKVKSTFNRYEQVLNRRGLTGAQAAEAVLRQNGVTGVRIEWVAGKLNDHFDPRTNTIRLSNAVYSSTSVASVGVHHSGPVHELGHSDRYRHLGVCALDRVPAGHPAGGGQCVKPRARGDRAGRLVDAGGVPNGEKNADRRRDDLFCGACGVARAASASASAVRRTRTR